MDRNQKKNLGIETGASASERRIDKQGKTKSFLSAQTNSLSVRCRHTSCSHLLEWIHATWPRCWQSLITPVSGAAWGKGHQEDRNAEGPFWGPTLTWTKDPQLSLNVSPCWTCSWTLHHANTCPPWTTRSKLKQIYTLLNNYLNVSLIH